MDPSFGWDDELLREQGCERLQHVCIPKSFRWDDDSLVGGLMECRRGRTAAPRAQQANPSPANGRGGAADQGYFLTSALTGVTADLAPASLNPRNHLWYSEWRISSSRVWTLTAPS